MTKLLSDMKDHDYAAFLKSPFNPNPSRWEITFSQVGFRGALELEIHYPANGILTGFDYLIIERTEDGFLKIDDSPFAHMDGELWTVMYGLIEYLDNENEKRAGY